MPSCHETSVARGACLLRNREQRLRAPSHPASRQPLAVAALGDAREHSGCSWCVPAVCSHWTPPCLADANEVLAGTAPNCSFQPSRGKGCGVPREEFGRARVTQGSSVLGCFCEAAGPGSLLLVGEFCGRCWAREELSFTRSRLTLSQTLFGVSMFLGDSSIPKPVR